MTFRIAAVILNLVVVYAPLSWAFDASATVDRTHIKAGESLTLTVIVEGGAADVDTSVVADFRVISRGTATSMRIVNGRTSRETIYTFTLTPLRAGALRIPELTVRGKKEERRTAPIDIRVSEHDPGSEERRDVFVRADVSARELYIGQPTRYTLTLYTAVELRGASLSQKPSFNGFTSEQIGGERKYRKVLDGRRYEATELAFLLTPFRVGALRIEPAVLDVGILVRDQRRGRSFFDDSFFGYSRVEQRMLQTDPIAIEVRQPPAYHGTVEYTGLVGDFRMEAALLPPEATAGENPAGADNGYQASIREGDSVTLRIVLAGQGNIRDASLPALRIPDGIRMYQSDPEEEIAVDETGYSGRKVFSAALAPVRPGDYELPPVELAIFDPAREAYRVLSAGPFRLAVTPCPDKPPLDVFARIDGDDATRLQRKKVMFTGRDILPLKEDLDALKDNESMSIWMFLMMLALPVGACLTAGSIIRRRSREESLPDKMVRRARDALKSVDAATTDELFFGGLRRALVSAVFAAAGTGGESLTSEEAGTLLMQSGISPDIADRAAELLRVLDDVRYGGGAKNGSAGEELSADVRAVIRRLL